LIFLHAPAKNLQAGKRKGTAHQYLSPSLAEIFSILQHPGGGQPQRVINKEQLKRLVACNKIKMGS
jgi:hypothetical protein